MVVAEVIVFRNSLSSAAVTWKTIHLEGKFCIIIFIYKIGCLDIYKQL